MKIKRRLSSAILVLLFLAGCGGMNEENTNDMMNSGGISSNMLAEMMTTPEMQDAMIRVMSSPEMQDQMVEMMKQPEMQNAIITIMQTPEMKEILKNVLNEG